MKRVFATKEFGFNDELVKFINDNEIEQGQICQITYNKHGNVVLYYWKLVRDE